MYEQVVVSIERHAGLTPEVTVPEYEVPVLAAIHKKINVIRREPLVRKFYLAPKVTQEQKDAAKENPENPLPGTPTHGTLQTEPIEEIDVEREFQRLQTKYATAKDDDGFIFPRVYQNVDQFAFSIDRMQRAKQKKRDAKPAAA